MNEWGSHLMPLMACCAASNGAVLEVGMGDYSTPLLHSYCVAAGRLLVSVETNTEWREKFRWCETPNHRIPFINDYSDLRIFMHQHFGVVFLDQSHGDRRAGDAMLFRDSAEYIVIHDAQADDVMGPLKTILPQFQFNRMYDRYFPHTMVLSNKRPIPEGI